MEESGRRSKASGHLQLHSELEASLASLRPLINNDDKNNGVRWLGT